MINENRIVNEFIKYVKIDSPTKEEYEFATFISNELSLLGFEVSMDNAGENVGSNSGNVVGYLKGNLDKEPILFSCHMDTVSPSRGIKPIIKDGIIHSDGTTILGGDNKAGIAGFIEAIKLIKENDIPHGPIEVVFSIYEEGGLFGVKNLDMSLLKSKKAFVLDSSTDPGSIIVQAPSQDHLEIKVIGKASHAGAAPENGISAIMVAAEAISNMKLLRVDEDTTANIGVIEGGGATNIVTSEVLVKAESRSLSNEKLDIQSLHMVKCFEDAAKKFGAKVESKVERMYETFKMNLDNDVVKHVIEAYSNINLDYITRSTGGGSDTNIFNSKGISSVNLGIGAKKPHTLEEHIHIKDLVTVAKMVLELIKVAK